MILGLPEHARASARAGAGSTLRASVGGGVRLRRGPAPARSQPRCVASLMSGSGEAATMTTQLVLRRAKRLTFASSEQCRSESEK
jgi:hypothetical protein